MTFKVRANSKGQSVLEPSPLPTITAAEVTGANNGSRPDLLQLVNRVYMLDTDNTICYKVQAGVMAVYLSGPPYPADARNTGTASFTVADNTDVQVLAGSGTIVVTFPLNVYDGEELVVALETGYTAITFAGNGKTVIAGAAMLVAAGSYAKWRYRAANTTWYRVG